MSDMQTFLFHRHAGDQFRARGTKTEAEALLRHLNKDRARDLFALRADEYPGRRPLMLAAELQKIRESIN